MTWINKYIMLMFALVFLSACSSSYKEVFDSDGPSLQSQYGQTINKNYVGYSTGDLKSYTRDAQTEIHNLFPELPNPRLTIYVFPHLSADNAPIPGYSTAFYLYDHQRVFALPGENL